MRSICGGLGDFALRKLNVAFIRPSGKSHLSATLRSVYIEALRPASEAADHCGLAA
jgi:hypothetical protein